MSPKTEPMEAQVIQAVRPWAIFLISSVSMTVSIIIWCFGTFATIKYVDNKHEDAIKHSDINFERNHALFEQINDALKRIDERTWEITRKGK